MNTLAEHQKKNKKKSSPWTIVFALVGVVALVVAGYGAWHVYRVRQQQEQERIANENMMQETVDVDAFYDGVFVDDVSLGGLSMEQAKERVYEAQAKELAKFQGSVNSGNESLSYTAADLAPSFNTDDILSEAWNLHRNGSLQERYDAITALPKKPVKLTTEIVIDPSGLRPAVETFVRSLDKEPVEPAILSFNAEKPEEDRFTFSEGTAGVATDFDATWKALEESISNRDFGAIEAVTTEIPTIETVEQLKAHTGLVVHFQTNMVNDSNRIHNIKLACAAINGTMLMPGEEFSYNGTTGKRTAEKGYREAGVIKSGKLDVGLAGGVCQVSGTLFNAAVKADLLITERYNHSHELAYLKRGLDATVDYGRYDLKFKNTKTTPVYIAMYTDGLKVVAEVYGVALDDGMTIELKAETLETKPAPPPRYVADASIPVGGKKTYPSYNGLRVKTYKIYKDAAGETIKKTDLEFGLSVYPLFVGEIHVNPADMPGATTPAPAPTPEATEE